MIYRTAIVVTYEHKYKSCFKKNKFCRYWNPHKLSVCTKIGSDIHDPDRFDINQEDEYRNDKVFLKRCMGCEYMNGFNPILFLLCKSNTDTSLLRSHNGDYSIKYSVKTQETVDSDALMNHFFKGLTRSFEKREMIEAMILSMEETKKGSSRMYSLLWHYTNILEMNTTMASFYILHQSYPMFQSHDVETLVLSSGLSAVDGEEQMMAISHVDNNGTFRNITSYGNYLLRPDCSEEFNNMSWNKYVRLYDIIQKPIKRRKKTAKTTSVRPNEINLLADETDELDDNEIEDRKSHKHQVYHHYRCLLAECLFRQIR